MLRWPFCFSYPVSTNHEGEIPSSVSPAGNQTENNENPFRTAPKAIQKQYAKIMGRMVRKYEDRQVLRLRLENCIAFCKQAEDATQRAIIAWTIHGNVSRAKVALMKAEFALKGISDELGD